MSDETSEPTTPPDAQRDPGWRTRARQLAVVVAVSLVLRAWALAEQRAGNPILSTEILDDAVYLDLARDFADGAAARPWFLAPLYAWVLGLIGKIAGAKAISMLTASVVSLCCGLATTALVTVAARTAAGARAGWIAGLLHAAAGTFVFGEIIPGQEPMLATLYALALVLTQRWHRDRAGWAATAFGAVAGLATLGRGTSLFLLPAALAVLLARAPGSLPAERRGIRAALPAVGLALAGLAAVLAPAALRNHDVTGDVTPLPWAFGSNLYASNGPEARKLGTFQSTELGTGPRAKQENAPRIAERELGRKLTPMEVSAYWRKRTIDERGPLGELAAHLGLKGLLFVADHDIASNHSPFVERRYATWLRVVPVTGWWILAFGAFGWWVLRRSHPEANAVAVLVALTAGSLILLFPATRYRLPLLPLCAVVGAAGAVRFTAAPVARRGVALGLAGVVAVLAFLPGWLGELQNQHGASRANVAVRLLEEKRTDEAVALLEEGHAEEPEHQRLLHLLARALSEAGRPREAATAQERLQGLIDAGPVGRLRRIAKLTDEGRTDRSALEEARRVAVGLEAELFSTKHRTNLHVMLAVVAARLGDVAEAERHAEEARRLSPDDATVRAVTERLASEAVTPGDDQ